MTRRGAFGAVPTGGSSLAITLSRFRVALVTGATSGVAIARHTPTVYQVW